MLYIPFIGWFIELMFAFFVAIPIYFIWNFIAPIYFTFLPPVWLSIPFWHMVLLCVLIPFLRSILLPSTSSSSSSSSSTTKK